MKKIKYLFVLLIMFAVSIINAQSSKDSSASNKLVKTEFSVKGMTCQGCVKTVNNIMKNIDGVTKSDVNLQEGKATIVYDPNKTNPASIESKFDKLPYKVVEKKNALNKNKKVKQSEK